MDEKTWTKIEIQLSENENQRLENYLCQLMKETLNYIQTTHDSLETIETINSKVVMLQVSYAYK